MEKKKVVRRRKSKKDRENPITAAIRLAVESGKVEFGMRKGLLNGIKGSAKVLVVAANLPKAERDKVLKAAQSSNSLILEFSGSSMELGSICGKPFPVSVLSIYDPGTSNIVELTKK